jgi:NTE family protein
MLPITGVFAGGGVKGVALAGAAAGTLDAGCRFEHVVGTSSGALVASLVAAGYGPDDLRRVITEVAWREMFTPLSWRRVPVVGKGLSILVSRAQYDADRLEATWERLLAAKGIRTFGDIEGCRLRVVTTDLTHQTGVVLPDQLAEYGHEPDHFSVARAVRMSAAVPFFVRPVRLADPRDGEVSEFVDGALTSNFPLIVGRWSEVRPLVGFRFREELPRPSMTFRGPASMARGVVTASIAAADAIRTPDEQQGTIIVKIPLGGDPLDFELSHRRAGQMFDVGRQAAMEAMPEVVAEAGRRGDTPSIMPLPAPVSEAG